MAYAYTGPTAEALATAYREDEPPFPTDNGRLFPERRHLRDEVAQLKQLLFPRCWNGGELLEDPAAIRERLTRFGESVSTGVAAYADGELVDHHDLVDDILDDLPAIRAALKLDVEAAYKGDPAANSYCEIIRSYPGFHAILMQRVARTIYEIGAEEYARELTEYAKSETGIDIHPGARIGEHCFIDHGTGVVIGETATVGDWVRIYQNVTLGALHFEEAESDEHLLRKDYKRHPDIGDHVVIGAGSKILGDISIGDHVSIGANSWVAEDIPDHTSVFISNHPEQERKRTE